MRHGDAVAFTRLYELHYDAILRYARRRIDEQAARDVAAEAFLIAWRRAPEVPDDQPLAWLYAVARNVLANAHRRRRREEAGLPAVGLPATEPDHADGVVQVERVRAALARLGPGDQEVLQLVAWEDLDVGAAAQVVGCSRTAFAVRLHRARRRLSRLLTDERPPPPPAPNRSMVATRDERAAERETT